MGKTRSQVIAEHSAIEPRPFGNTDPLGAGAVGAIATPLFLGIFLLILQQPTQGTEVAFGVVWLLGTVSPWFVVRSAQRHYDRKIDFMVDAANARTIEAERVQSEKQRAAPPATDARPTSFGPPGLATDPAANALPTQAPSPDDDVIFKRELDAIFIGTRWNGVRHFPFKVVFYRCCLMSHVDDLYPIGCFESLQEAEQACKTFVDAQLLESLTKIDRLRLTIGKTPFDDVHALAAELVSNLEKYGEMPVILGRPSNGFTAPKYADDRAEELARAALQSPLKISH